MASYVASDPEVTAVTEYISSMLGAPVITVELSATNYVTAFNTSIEEYSNYITQWAIRSNIANSLGLDNATDFTQKWVSSSLDFASTFAKAYAEQANVGGDVPINKSYIELVPEKQDYYLPNDIVISEVMWQEPSAITRYLVDPNNNPAWVQHEFGWAYMGQSYMYIIPSYFSIQLAQNTDMRWKLWKGDYMYKITPAPSDATRESPDYTGQTRNRVSIFPTPGYSKAGTRVWYFYKNVSDLNKYDSQTAGSLVHNPGTMKMDEIPYSAFNSSSKRWVKQYSLATAKEILGRIRGKYGQLPIPDAEIQLDGESLIAEAREQQQQLRDSLKEQLELIDVSKLLEIEADKAEHLNRQLSYSPTLIFRG